jgi:hypothetical protein
MSPEEKVRLTHIVEAVVLIARYVEGVSKREFFRGHVAARCGHPKNPDNRRSRAAFVTPAFVQHA